MVTYSQKLISSEFAVKPEPSKIYSQSEVKTIEFLLALASMPFLITNHGHKLWQLFPSLEDLFKCEEADLVQLGLKDEEIRAISQPNWTIVEKHLRWAEDPLNSIVTYKDERFPPLLKEIANPPLLLFVQGPVEKLQDAQIAMVGSRKPTHTGKEIAFNFAKELAEVGLVITSGFAMGIDAASHLGALEGQGATIAVMGTGLDKIYPKMHLTLKDKILDQGGVLLSEFPLGTSAIATHFPLRNRIISGLSLGVLVVEAVLYSGSLITARLATEQGREVFAIPGSIFNPLARGCHSIIRQGAKLVESVPDVLEELRPYIKTQEIFLKQNIAKQKNNLDRNYKKLLECIGFETTPVDILITRSGFTASKIGAMLTVLELNGLINAIPGGYRRVEL